MAAVADTSAKPAEPSREDDPRNPVRRLERLFDSGDHANC